jgi:hypothetical protein
MKQEQLEFKSGGGETRQRGAECDLDALRPHVEAKAVKATRPAGLLIHVHCGSCDWDGMGDPEDACYRCQELDSLREVRPDDERCIHCGLRAKECECDEL